MVDLEDFSFEINDSNRNFVACVMGKIEFHLKIRESAFNVTYFYRLTTLTKQNVTFCRIVTEMFEK